MRKILNGRGFFIRLLLVTALLISAFFGYAFAEQPDENAGQADEPGDGKTVEQAIEQVVICKPLIRVDYRGAADQIPVVYLDGEQLVSQSGPVRIGESEIGIEYYALLDVSGSLSYERFEDIKQSMQQFITELREQDRLVLYTFGDTVKLILNGDEDRETAASTIAALENGDMNTALFEALTDASSEIEAISEDGMHRLIICISDGEDFADNTKDAQTVSDRISSKGIPVYTIAVEKKSETEEEARTNRSSFSAVAANTGGIPWTVDMVQDGIGSVYENSVMNGLHIIQDAVLNTNHMDLTASTNKKSMKIEDLVLRFPDGKELTKKVLVSKNTEDDQFPSVTDISVISENEIRITYSEAVAGAEKAENYKLSGDRTIAISQVIAENASAHSYSLILGEDLVNGDYSLQIQNVTDDSQEKNPLELYSEPQPFIVTEFPEETEETEAKDMVAPAVSNISVVNGNEISITYSEAVAGAERAENYKLSGDRTIAISQVIAEDPSTYTYSLILADDLENGEYTLQIQNVTDASTEKNPLQVYGEPQPLTVEGLPEETEPETEPKDLIVPTVAEIKASEPDGFEITFSEPVAGAEINGNYSVTLDGKDMAVVQSKALDGDGIRYKIVLAQNLVNGDYTIRMSHITDQSDQANLLEENAWSAKVQGVKQKTDLKELLIKWWPVVLTIIVLILLFVVVLNSRRVKKNSVTLIEGVAVERDHINRKVQVNVGDNTKTRDVEIEINNGTDEPKRVPYAIRGNLTVGRSREDCDIFCNDAIMSRKHFQIISEQDGHFYVEDLGSKNGTYVNGTKISQKTMLQSGDEIRAGKMHFRIKWTV